MLDRLETMINAMEDPDWAWGPLVRFRPPKDVMMDRRYWLTFFLPLLVTITLLIALIMPLVWMLMHGTFPSLSLFPAYYLGLLRYTILSTPYPMDVCLLMCIGLIVITWAWNRRADRLQREPIPEPLPEIRPEGVWPPAPRI